MFGSSRQIFRAKALERISSPDDLDEMIQIVSPKDWLVLVVLGALLALALLWSIVGRLPVMVEARGVLTSPPTHTGTVESALFNVSFVAIGSGQAIRPGMRVHVTPDAIERQRFGSITGEVVTVSERPTTMDEATSLTGSVTLAQELLGDGPRLAVIARLDQDHRTQSGYHWSSSRGPRLGLNAGLTTSMRVMVERRRPITYLLPFVRQVDGAD